MFFGTVVALGFIPSTVHAANGSLYLSPATKNVNKGDSFNVQVRVRTGGDAVNAVQANLSYPSALLDYVGISVAGSGFDVTAQGSGGGGSIQIARGAISDVNGDALVATVTFRAKLDGGVAEVVFAGGSAVVRSSDNIDILTGSSGGRYTLYAYIAPKPGVDLPTAGAKDTTAPVITNIHVTNISPTTATVTWQTDEDSSSVVEYGLNNDYGLVAQTAGNTKDHKVVLNSVFIEPVTDYRFRVKSADGAGNTATSSDQGFATTGYSVDIRVLDNKSQPVSLAKVMFEGIAKFTNTDGVAHFLNIKPGSHTVAAEARGFSGTTKVLVAPTKDKDGNLVAQLAELKVTTFLIAGIPLYLVVIIALGTALAAGLGLWLDITHNYRLIRRVRSKFKRPKAPEAGL